MAISIKIDFAKIFIKTVNHVSIVHRVIGVRGRHIICIWLRLTLFEYIAIMLLCFTTSVWISQVFRFQFTHCCLFIFIVIFCCLFRISPEFGVLFISFNIISPNNWVSHSKKQVLTLSLSLMTVFREVFDVLLKSPNYILYRFNGSTIQPAINMRTHAS